MTTNVDFHNIIVDCKSADYSFANKFVAKLNAEHPGMFTATELESFSMIAEILAGSDELKESVQASETKEDACEAIEDNMNGAIKDVMASYERLYTDHELYEFERDCFAYEFLTA